MKWRVWIWSIWLVLSGTAGAGVLEVVSVGLTVGDLPSEIAFYTEVLPFNLQSVQEESGPAIEHRTGVDGAKIRTATLRLGKETLTLTEFGMPKGRPIPVDSRSHDHWFQHVALVVRDMDQAYAWLRQNNVRHVSTGPQTLPDWNPQAGGIRAFYFRDPEDHVLEIIWFPPGKGDPRWQQAVDGLFLGIDHTAIVVSDTERSLAFYRDLLGFRVAGESENYGSEQEHLNQVFGARLRITGLRAGQGPGVEFLEYVAPPGGRPLPSDSRANDLVYWQTRLRVDDGPKLLGRLQANVTRLVSRDWKSDSGLIQVRDPDGHGLLLHQSDADLIPTSNGN